MQAPVLNATIPSPPVRPSMREDDARSPVRSRGLVVDLGPLVPQPIPDWDWRPDDERRGR